MSNTWNMYSKEYDLALKRKYDLCYSMDALEEEMATHSSVLAWRIPWTEEPGGLQSTGSQELHMTGRLNHTATTPAWTNLENITLSETGRGFVAQ